MSQTPEWNKDNGGDEDVQMPLGVGESSGATESAGYTDGAKSRIGGSTIALLGAFAAALIALYLLGLQNKPRQADAQRVSNDNQLADAITKMIEEGGVQPKLPGVFDNDIVRLYRILTARPVSVNTDLPRNPFALDVKPVEIGGTAPPPLPLDDPEAPILLQVAHEFENLRLQTVIMGKNPVAMINNSIVAVGARTSDHLTVAEIQSDHVVLAYKQNKFSLKLNSGGKP
jgi:hypothetical protein